MLYVGERKLPSSVWVEMSCPEHGLERFKIKVIKKYNVNKELIEPKFRTKPRHELAGVVVGKSVGHEEVREYLVGYFREAGMIDKILSMRFQI
jgi:hypothetical protein